MSEALSSTEIEDVLSSIRRLVSEDMRPANRAPGAAQPMDIGNKLILTPALRVVSDEAAAEVPMFVAHPRATDAGGIEDVMASLGAAVGPTSPEWESETGDVSADFSAALPDDWSLPESAADAPFVDTTEDVAAGGAEDNLTELLVPPQNFVFSEAETAAETAGQVIQPASLEPEVIPGWAQQDDAADDTAEAVPEPSLGTIEPDPEWANAAEASVIAALADDASDQDNESDLLPEDEEMLFNEDVLRELVRDILREELAGKMGERITRNIRKLVRAEIARSFAAQEFE